MKNRSNDPYHHEQTLLPRSYISLHIMKTHGDVSSDLKQLNGSTTKNRSDDPSHHEQTLLPQSYNSLHIIKTHGDVGSDLERPFPLNFRFPPHHLSRTGYCGKQTCLHNTMASPFLILLRHLAVLRRGLT